MHVTALWASGMRGAGRLLGGGSVAIERAADWPGVVQAPGGQSMRERTQVTQGTRNNLGQLPHGPKGGGPGTFWELGMSA